MDAKLKARWVEALRGGEYQQNFYNVGQGTKLCCVGVGGAISGLNPDVHNGSGSGQCAAALGLTMAQAQVLFDMNDNDKKSFSEIADYIEANL